MERILDDFTENVRDGLLNLFVDAMLDISLRVNVDVTLGLVALVIEDVAVAVLLEVEHI